MLTALVAVAESEGDACVAPTGVRGELGSVRGVRVTAGDGEWSERRRKPTAAFSSFSKYDRNRN